MLPVAILAGGLAKRLRPITNTVPKAIVEISGKPFIFHQLSYLRKQGIKKVVICTGYLGKMIEDQVGNGSRFDMKVFYSSDGSKLLGTGGAIKKALPILGNKFFILYGDTFLPIRFNFVEQEYLSNNLLALMTVLKNNSKWDKSNVLFKNNKLIQYNKKKPSNNMKYIDYGLSAVSAKIFDSYSNQSFFDLSEVFEKLSLNNQLGGFRVYKRFYEIGNPRGFIETEKYLLKLKNQ